MCGRDSSLYPLQDVSELSGHHVEVIKTRESCASSDGCLSTANDAQPKGTYLTICYLYLSRATQTERSSTSAKLISREGEGKGGMFFLSDLSSRAALGWRGSEREVTTARAEGLASQSMEDWKTGRQTQNRLRHVCIGPDHNQHSHLWSVLSPMPLPTDGVSIFKCLSSLYERSKMDPT